MDAQVYLIQKALIRKDGKILVLKDPFGCLDFPGGKMQVDDINHFQSLTREVKEECGLEITIGRPVYTLTRTFTQEHRLGGKKAFFIVYEGEYVSGEVKLSEEHQGYAWIDASTYTSVDDGKYYFEVLKSYFS